MRTQILDDRRMGDDRRESLMDRRKLMLDRRGFGNPVITDEDGNRGVYRDARSQEE